MDAIDTLKQEHRIIEEALLALETWTDGVLRRAADDKDELTRFVIFLDEFADACHHGKEEKILFASMAERGLPPDRGPIAVMLAEHERGRALIRVLDTLARRRDRWGDKDRLMLADAVHAYASLMREHIHKEESVLYSMIEARSSAETRAEISRRFEGFEANETGIVVHERLHELAESLIAAHLPRSSGEAHAHHH